MTLKLADFLKIFLIAFCILNTIALAYGQCVVEVPGDVRLRPKFLLKIGSRKIEVIIRKTDTYISFFNKQKVEVQCETKFQYPEQYNNKHKMELKCENNYLYPTNNYNDYYRSFVCSPQKWNLYETFQNFIWCPSNTSSYLLGRPKDAETTKYENLAGICFDTINLSFKTLYYAISPKHSEQLHTTSLTESYKPRLEINHIKETFTPKNVTETDYDTEEFRDWIKYSQYNYSSVIQNSLLVDDFNDQLGSMLDVAWWPSLRLGNWKHYEAALTRHVESQNQSYNIMSGVSSVATAPIMENCQRNYTLKQLTDNKNKKIPMYIWNYLRSTTNISDEIVIIGFNTPFYEFYDQKEIVFCEDKCQEIPWLKKASTTFRYRALGVIICCSSEDVKASNRLDGFPLVDIDAKPPEYEITDETTVQYESISSERQYD